MTKQISKFSLMAALVCGLSLGFVSCSDDDDSSPTGEVVNPEQTDEAIKAWSWVSVLTDETDQQEGWQNKSYAVTIGEPSSNPLTNARLIYVSDLQDARQRFAAFVGCKPEELTGAKTISAGDYGKMEWTPSAGNAANLAVVKVESKLFKELDQIIFCTEEQAPDNASDLSGNCYYRLGDVIEDKEGYYWVCVQPSFQGKKFKESYWINVFNANPETGKGEDTKLLPGIPEKNIYSKYDGKYNGNTILLPTCLKMDRKQNHNLSNLLWAMINPEDFATKDNLVSVGIAGLPKEYHGINYMKLVKEAWEDDDNEIFEKLFNRSVGKMEKMTLLNFFYNGYHWKVGSTAGVWIYRSVAYDPVYSGSLDDDDTLFEMKKEGYGFDIRRYAGDPNQNPKCSQVSDSKCAPAKQFFRIKEGDASEKGYWVIRVATGKQLDKNYNPYKQMNDVHDVYTFNDEYEIEVGAEEDVPSETDLKEKVGDDDDDDDD